MRALVSTMAAVDVVSATDNALELSVKTTLRAPLHGAPHVGQTVFQTFKEDCERFLNRDKKREEVGKREGGRAPPGG